MGDKLSRGSMVKRRIISLTLLFAIVLSVVIGFIDTSPSYAAAGDVKKIGDLPIGSIIQDKSNATKWLVIKRNHTGYPSNSTTIFANEFVGQDRNGTWTTPQNARNVMSPNLTLGNGVNRILVRVIDERGIA
jgi:hypothetical protein